MSNDTKTENASNEVSAEQSLQAYSLRRKQPIEWFYAIVTVVTHLGCLIAPFYFTYSGLLIALVLYFVTGCLGITLGYHRLLTHNSFSTFPIIRYALTLCGCLGFMGGPLIWVGSHRIHHAHSDKEKDPHSPNHGFLWSHILWVLFKEPPGHKSLSAVNDLRKDSVMLWLDRLSFIPQIICIFSLYLGGELISPAPFGQGLGLSWLLWGVFVRTAFLFHASGSVNSFTHTFGYKNFRSSDRSKNLWWVALIAFGEGWHNNHHAQQRSAAHGMKWWELDLTYSVIKTLERLGLAWDVVEPVKNYDAVTYPIPSQDAN